LLRRWALPHDWRARHVEIARTVTALLGLVVLVELAIIVPWVETVTAWGIASAIVCLLAVLNARSKKP
jgi:hypothetical protein